MANTVSYKSPFYAKLSSDVERRLSLPRGLLHRIVTLGERSNADEISPAGARTVFQIIPATREAVLKKHGVDAYRSPQDAALAAGHILKDSLRRNRGDIRAAVAEYHGGTDRRQWGPRTIAYVNNVTGRNHGARGRAPQEAHQASGESTFDRVTRRRRAERDHSGPSIADIYTAYRTGKMRPDERAEFEADVEAGAIMLPRGASLQKRAASEPPVLPAGVIEAYNSGQMAPEERAELDHDLRKGLVRLPHGEMLSGPKPRTTGENLALGVRGVLEGGADLLGIVANPVNALINMTGIPQALGGKPLSTNLGQAASDALSDAGVPQVRPEEELTNRVIRGATGGLGTAGLAREGANLATGVTREVLKTIGAAPVTDVVSGGASGGGGKIGGDVAGVPGEVVGSLAGGLGGVVGAGGARRAGEAFANTRLGRATTETVDEITSQIVRRFPRPVLVDDAGKLTEDGMEVLARTGVEPEQLVSAYRRGSESMAPSSRFQETAHNDNAPPPPAAQTGAAREVPVAGTPPIAGAGEIPTPRIDETSGPSSGSIGGARQRANDMNANFAEAQSEGVQLTRGQAEQNFRVQNDEQSLRAAATGEGERARQFLAQQQEQIKDAVTRFREGFGDTSATASERGTTVKEAIRGFRDQGAAGVKALYRTAQAMGGGGLKLDTHGIADAAKRAMVEADIPDAVKGVIRQEMARYGLIGKVDKTAEDGLTTVQLNDGRKVQFYGQPQELTVANADEFRKAISAQYMADGPRKLSQHVKIAIDDSVEDAMERAAKGETTGPVGKAYQAAREAHRTQKQAFSAKDVIDRLIAFKTGTDTDLVLPERAIAEALGTGKEGVSNLKKVKAILLSKPTQKSRQAWAAIQAQGLANIFDQAVNVQTGDISGARLNAAIAKFGAPKLKILLEEGEFGQLMKLRRIISNATVPMSGTTNPSGTFYKLANFLTKGALRFTAGFGDAAVALAGKARDLAATRRTLEGITSYDGRIETGRRFDQQAREFIEAFIEEGTSGRLLPPGLQSVGATTSAPEGEGQTP